MKIVTINERAAAVAMDAIVGPEARVAIENLYTLLDEAERTGRDEGFTYGFNCGSAMSDIIGNASWFAGFDAGYGATKTAADAPDVIYLPPYEGDRGDETKADDSLPPMQEQGSNPFAWSQGPQVELNVTIDDEVARRIGR